MKEIIFALILAVGLFLGMLACLELGRRLGVRRLRIDPDGVKAGTGAVEGAIFALLGLLVAFTFSGAASRFDTRRELIVTEANAIGTAYLRIDVLPTAFQEPLREDFRRYVEARLKTYRLVSNVQAAKAELSLATALQKKIWAQAIAATQAEGAPSSAMMLFLPPLNDMFDITTTRTMSLQMHPPYVIFGMLCTLALAGALLAGNGMAGARSRSWLHIVGFALALSLSVFIILDIEYPRLGLVRVDSFDQALVSVRAGMN
ncbi:MAG: DUF4239 domain-containing protein [Gammaproteobacteria bacterium]|nr:DUF4239 domain-containing protein [Gammaproteobacteria bacterium]